MVDFGDFLATVLMIKVKRNRCESDPCVFFCFNRNVTMGTHVDDPFGCGQAAVVDSVFTDISHFVVLIGDAG